MSLRSSNIRVIILWTPSKLFGSVFLYYFTNIIKQMLCLFLVLYFLVRYSHLIPKRTGFWQLVGKECRLCQRRKMQVHVFLHNAHTSYHIFDIMYLPCFKHFILSIIFVATFHFHGIVLFCIIVFEKLLLCCISLTEQASICSCFRFNIWNTV